MISSNQIIVFIGTLLISSFFLLTLQLLSTDAYAGTTTAFVCCEVTGFGNMCQPGNVCEQEAQILCLGSESVPVCNESNSEIGQGAPCTCIEQIPTLSQWGKIITIAVIGLFAVIGLLAMRRRNAVNSD